MGIRMSFFGMRARPRLSDEAQSVRKKKQQAEAYDQTFYFAAKSEIEGAILLRQLFFLTGRSAIMSTCKGIWSVAVRGAQSIRRRQDGRGANRRQSS